MCLVQNQYIAIHKGTGFVNIYEGQSLPCLREKDKHFNEKNFIIRKRPLNLQHEHQATATRKVPLPPLLTSQIIELYTKFFQSAQASVFGHEVLSASDSYISHYDICNPKITHKGHHNKGRFKIFRKLAQNQQLTLNLNAITIPQFRYNPPNGLTNYECI